MTKAGTLPGVSGQEGHVVDGDLNHLSSKLRSIIADEALTSRLMKERRPGQFSFLWLSKQICLSSGCVKPKARASLARLSESGIVTSRMLQGWFPRCLIMSEVCLILYEPGCKS